MKNLTGDERYDELWEELEDTREGGEITMCELLDKYWNSGVQHGVKQENARMLIQVVDSLITNTSWTLQHACESIGYTVEEYTQAKHIQAT